ncbi:N-acetylmuramoyl-L-alanine amidase [Anaerococcus hydrogenalis]|uniref:N-acetylmuramoyl-L-alanine amidase n=1 Tax=Anaerococcus hydrogenalis ACS-025-V-Sch4 TaxID=879306 RepID=F0H1M5_9FIRM|nr:N-acetylmuramoyl-L-alanine amidase [Anaerococcus hydrogenalis]EGC83557.1 SH3 domain protein [Anaerococcus hydrogenalis ACS-025-V-Sch4]
MSNSSLVDFRDYSPNHSGTRNEKITKIAIHHTAGVLTAQRIGSVFKSRNRQASCNYGVGSDGKIVLVVDECNRAWTTSSSWCDNRAVTIETSNSQYGGNWPVSDLVLNRLIDLVTDICKRNNIYPCTYTGGTDGVLQKHEWYAQTTCPGPYLGSKFSYIASEVNKRLKGGNYTAKTVSDLYRVRKSWQDSKSQKGAFKNLESAKSLAKKYNYKVYNKNGNQVWPEVKKANTNPYGGVLIKDENWSGITQAVCNVRSAPSTSAEIVATYGVGQEIHYDQVYEGDGYRWISYVGRQSGKRRFVAFRKLSEDTTPWIKF